MSQGLISVQCSEHDDSICAAIVGDSCVLHIVILQGLVHDTVEICGLKSNITLKSTSTTQKTISGFNKQG